MGTILKLITMPTTLLIVRQIPLYLSFSLDPLYREMQVSAFSSSIA